ncbi:MAG: DUF4167 domain-containing protein [Acetobacteraceae bacterium]|nr:DUF4167 domain-containing protein [Acetobacteraceae bacterium]MCX7684776.1 DUF4167 domain-containing protein [Acetobacteraceae bacterium]MDW8399227.1 DUF4167 domain-containing protein [Acetobacteraceae bacterium]
MNMKRMRGRGQRHGGQFRQSGGGQVPTNRNHVFDSNGPDVRVRGTAQQLFERYLQLGRDATGSGDRVLAESYFQHAEHYFRILNAMNLAAQQHQQAQHGQRMWRQEQPGEAEGEANGYGPAEEEGEPGEGSLAEARGQA